MTVMEMLAEFCLSHNNSRYAMDKPFRVGDFVYATDGRAAVRVRASTAPDVGEIEKPPPVGGVFPSDTSGMTAYPIPHGLPKDRFPCPECKGERETDSVECPDCCCRFKITGKSMCQRCEGTGTEATNIRRRIGPVTYLNEMLLDRVRRAGATTAWVHSRDKTVYFAWEGGEAVVVLWGLFQEPALADLGYPAAVRTTGTGCIEAVDEQMPASPAGGSND